MFFQWDSLTEFHPNPDTLCQQLENMCYHLSQAANRMRYKGGNFQWLEQYPEGRGYPKLKIRETEFSLCECLELVWHRI